jgi:hypothetical protein
MLGASLFENDAVAAVGAACTVASVIGLSEQRLSSRCLEVEAQVINLVGPKGTRRLRHFVSRSSPGAARSAGVAAGISGRSRGAFDLSF